MDERNFIETENGIVYRVENATTYRRQYETAAWYAEVLVQPGDYPARFTDPHGREVSSIEDAWYVKVTFDATLTYEHTPTLLFGSAVNDGGSGPRNEPMRHTVETYAYRVRAALQEKEVAA